MDSSSWQNTLTTFCPVMVSSMKPLSLPMFFCWAIKFLPEYFDTCIVVNSMSATIASVRIVSGMLSTSIMDKILTIVITLLKSCGTLWLIICLSVSISLV